MAWALSEKIKKLFSRHAMDEDFFDDLTDALIEGDIGAKNAMELVDALKKECTEQHISDEQFIMNRMKEMLLAHIKTVRLQPEKAKTNIWMVLGVNGVGKTTSVAKLAQWYDRQDKGSVVLAAADTFRAAAIDQLKIHGERLGVRVVNHQDGSDPGAVVFDAADAVRAKGGGLVIADTAGRLHNKENLVRELQKIDRIASQKADAGCYKKILVIDVTTGQNALRQAEVFNEAVGVDAVVMAKYDSTAKGGIAVSVCKELGIPVAFVCTGERYDDIAVFDSAAYVSEFLGA